MKNKKGGFFLWGGIILIVLMVIVVGIVFISHAKGGKNQNATQLAGAKDYSLITKGVGFVTKNNFVDDLKTANEAGLVFLNAKSTNGEIPQVIKTGFESGYLDYPVPNMAADGSDMSSLKTAYMQLVDKYHPYYIGLGNEIETMTDEDKFVAGYNDLYDAIKRECDNSCIVYPVFQYEHFNPALADKMKMDLLVFTSYPFSNYSNLNNIPSDYYSAAQQEASKKGVKIAFTEIGWPNTQDFQSGETDPQVAFYKKFKELTSGMDVQFAGWGLLYGAPEIGNVWADMGLLNSDGSKKPLFNEFAK